jgi:hypothetical protein
VRLTSTRRRSVVQNTRQLLRLNFENSGAQIFKRGFGLGFSGIRFENVEILQNEFWHAL